MSVKKELKLEEQNQQEFDCRNKGNPIYHIQQLHNHYGFELNYLGVRKTDMDYLMYGQNFNHFKTTINDQNIEQPINENNIKNQHCQIIKNQNEMDCNPNLQLAIWRWSNGYQDHHEKEVKKFHRPFEKEEMDNEKIQNSQYLIKRQYLEDQISNYILSMHDDQHQQNDYRQQKDERLPATEYKYSYNIQQETRRQKVIKYLQKKQRRCFLKKVTYQCRKEVADNRIRIKGRFINYNQAVAELGLDPNQKYTASYLKQLTKKSQSSK